MRRDAAHLLSLAQHRVASDRVGQVVHGGLYDSQALGRGVLGPPLLVPQLLLVIEAGCPEARQSAAGDIARVLHWPDEI